MDREPDQPRHPTRQDMVVAVVLAIVASTLAFLTTCIGIGIFTFELHGSTSTFKEMLPWVAGIVLALLAGTITFRWIARRR